MIDTFPRFHPLHFPRREEVSHMTIAAAVIVLATLLAMWRRHHELAKSNVSRRLVWCWYEIGILALAASCIAYAIQGDRKMTLLLCVLVAELMIIATVVVIAAARG